MAPQPDLIEGSRKPRLDLMDHFRDIHKELGVADIRQIVDVALNRGLVPDFIRLSCEKRGLNEMCREALKQKTEDGIPYAQPLDDGLKAKWKQTILFTIEQAIDLLQRKAKAIDCDIGEFRTLEQSYRDRFGDAIPPFTFS